MLTTETKSVVQSTIPLLQEHGLEITSTFYQLLFEKNPELLDIFNSSNQRDTSQSRALADAVVAYAANIDNLEALLPAVARIANKHASIGIKNEHYPLVGVSLLAAIQHVLALPDEHPALTAWGQAYGVLADVFINAENTLYEASATADGGWQGYRAFAIDEVRQETPEVMSLILSAKDGKAVKRFLGGQYVSVKLTGDDTNHDEIRQYSLSDWSDNYRLTIKKEAKGQVSNSLHSKSVGDEILLSPPYGEFNLNTAAKKHVFISGGVGITPLFTMAKQAISLGLTSDQLQFIECCRGAEHQIFKSELRALADNRSLQLKQAFEHGEGGDFSGRLTSDVLNAWLNDKSADVYICGPLPFMSQLKSLLNAIGFTDDKLHYEVFGPTTNL